MKVRRVLQAVPWPVLAGSVAFYWAGQVLSAAKWQLLLRSRGTRISLRECCRLYLTGMFWNLWVPTNIGGDAVRAYAVAPHCGGLSLAASSVLIERLTGLLALLVIGAIGLAIDSAHDGGTPGLNLIVMTAGVLLLGTAALMAVRVTAFRLKARFPQHSLVEKWAGLHRALDSYADPDHRPALAIALILSLVFQASQVLLNIGLAAAVGLDLPFVTFWWLVPLLALASLLPIGIGGLGVREAAAVTLLGGFGVSGGTVVAWSLLWQATVWLASLPGALSLGTRIRSEGQNHKSIS
jgi:uncharacterized protein (TIRG00374 family)